MRRVLLVLPVSFDFSPIHLAEVFAAVGRELGSAAGPQDAFRLLSEAAVRDVPGAEYAGITQGTTGTFKTVAATDQLVYDTDQIQYDLGTGPCVDAIVQDMVFDANDLLTDARWPEFGHRAFETTGIASMLSFRLFLVSHSGLVAGLNMYSRKRRAFDNESKALGLILATHGALAISAAVAREKANNLLQALKNSREIGVAMGVLMNRERITRDQAFDLLRLASQHRHRKLSEIAMDVADIGHLALPTHAQPAGRPSRDELGIRDG